MRGPLPLPVRTAHVYAVRRQRRGVESAVWAARDTWHPSNWAGEDVEPAHQFVWGRLSLDELMAEPPRPGEEVEGETSRFGALARRLWDPILAAGVRM